MVGRDEQHPGGGGHHEQGQVEYLCSQVNIPHPHEHLLLHLVKPRPVLNIPVLGRVQGPGVDRGVAVSDHHHIPQAAALQDRFQGAQVITCHWTKEGDCKVRIGESEIILCRELNG